VFGTSRVRFSAWKSNIVNWGLLRVPPPSTQMLGYYLEIKCDRLFPRPHKVIILKCHPFRCYITHVSDKALLIKLWNNKTTPGKVLLETLRIRKSWLFEWLLVYLTTLHQLQASVTTMIVIQEGCERCQSYKLVSDWKTWGKTWDSSAGRVASAAAQIPGCSLLQRHVR
jgi:hypothetical protein